MDAAELTEWIAYSQLEPWGEERADWRSALIVCTLANIHRDSKLRPRPYEITDFMPDFSGEAKQPQAQDPAAQMAAFMAATQGLKKRDGK